MNVLLALARRPLRRAVHDVRYVRPVPLRAARGPVRRVYRELERDFGMLAPPVALHAPAPSLLVTVWELLRATLLVDGRTTRREREAVAAAVSRVNRCSYCVEVHEAAAGSEDPDLVEPELVDVWSTFEYLNRMVTVFLPSSPLPVGAPAPARRVARRLFATAAGRWVEPCPVDRSAAELLADVADAADGVLGPALAGEVRAAVYDALAVPPGLTDPLPADPAVRLAVLVAVAPDRVTGRRVREVGGSDGLVVALAAAGAARAAAAATPVVGSRRVAG